MKYGKKRKGGKEKYVLTFIIQSKIMKKKITVEKWVPFWEKKIKMRDLAQFAEQKEVIRAIKHYYPNEKPRWYNAMAGVFTQLKTYPEVKQKNPKERIEIIVGGDRAFLPPMDKDGEGRDEMYSCSTNAYSLSFRKWIEVSNILISEETLKHYTAEEMLAHFIWEITWYGPEEQMLEKGKEMLESVKKLKKDVKKHPENVRPISELFDNKKKKYNLK